MMYGEKANNPRGAGGKGRLIRNQELLALEKEQS